MKIKPEHLDEMRAGFATFLAENPGSLAEHRRNLQPYAGDLDKRIRWDLLYVSKGSAWICATIYPYANDDHIDTALRQLAREFNLVGEE